ncbi:MAG: DUF4249 family protein [Saprospiraceae bacterium]|nr:DUF4249 family protein [Saprospiraceae bacterium]
MMRGLYFLWGLIFITGCIDTIEVDLPQRPAGRLVVAGVVERGPDDYRFLVDVVRTQDLEDEKPAVRESADIRILNQGVETLSLDNGQSLVFAIDSFHDVFGGTADAAVFNIEIKTTLGGVFTSLDQKVLAPPQGSTPAVRYEERSELNNVGNVVENGYVKLLMNSSLLNATSERVSLRWDVSGVFRFPERPWTDNPFIFVNTCYVKVGSKGNQINIVNSAEVNNNEVFEFEVSENEADYRFASGYYYTILQKAISNETASYWQELQKGVNRAGTIFDSPAGQIRSNITQTDGSPEDFLGYFYTAGVDTLRYLATWEETGKQFHLCARATVSDACCDCLLLVNSSYDKPHYWVD